MLDWAAHLTLMPVMALLIERVIPIRFKRVGGLTYGRITGWLAGNVLKIQTAIILITVLLVGLSVWKTARFLPDSLETDLNNLRSKMTFKSGSTSSTSSPYPPPSEPGQTTASTSCTATGWSATAGTPCSMR